MPATPPPTLTTTTTITIALTTTYILAALARLAIGTTPTTKRLTTATGAIAATALAIHLLAYTQAYNLQTTILPLIDLLTTQDGKTVATLDLAQIITITIIIDHLHHHKQTKQPQTTKTPTTQQQTTNTEAAVV